MADQLVPDGFTVPTTFPYGDWPPIVGMTLEANLAGLRDFAPRAGFSYTVLEPEDGAVIGRVYISPCRTPGFDPVVRCWVRADRAELGGLFRKRSRGGCAAGGVSGASTSAGHRASHPRSELYESREPTFARPGPP
ncbi:MAG TPA: hypothetical protein VGN22_18740 [Pseudonocardia sp.]